MMRKEIFFLVVICMCMYVASVAGTLVSENDVELENFKNAVRMRQKRSAADVQVLVKCSVPLAQENDGLTDKEKARKLGVCLARDALKNAAARKDNASEMVRRIEQLYQDKELSVSRRGWWKKAVGWVKKHAKIIWEGIQVAIKIVKAIG